MYVHVKIHIQTKEFLLDKRIPLCLSYDLYFFPNKMILIFNLDSDLSILDISMQDKSCVKRISFHEHMPRLVI